MRRIAEQRHPLGAPVVDRLSIEERPAVALIALGGVDDGLDLGMPAGVGGLELLPRSAHGPGLLVPRRVFRTTDKVEQLTATQPIHDAMVLGAAPHRAAELHE